MGGPEADARLDFASDRFDPAFALRSDAVALPCADARPLDNLSKCRYLLPPGDPNRVEASRPASRAAPKGESTLIQPRRQRVTGTTIVESLSVRHRKGPLGVLLRCLRHRKRVEIVTRRVDGPRGVLRGLVRAFDKHGNTVLTDAEEEVLVYVPVSLHGAAAAPPAPQSDAPLRAWLTTVLAAHAPAKVATVDAALAKYAGREAQLVAFVQRKYGVTSGPPGVEGSPPPSPLRPERYRAPDAPSTGWQRPAHPPPGFAARVFGPKSPHVALQRGVSGLPGVVEGESEFVCASTAERWRRGDPSRGLVTQVRHRRLQSIFLKGDMIILARAVAPPAPEAAAADGGR